MLKPQSESINRPSFAGGRRPRPRLEGRKNPALRDANSPHGDSARVVPKKLGMRGEAARRLQMKG